MGVELSAIINVIDAQIEVLRSLRKFRLRERPEQWTTMSRAIDMVVKGRKSFRENIKVILKDLQTSQQFVGFPFSNYFRELQLIRGVVSTHNDRSSKNER